MLRFAGMSIWRLLFLVFGFWMIVILFVTMELSSNFYKEDKDRNSLDRIELAERTVSELKSRNLELQRMLSSILKTNPDLQLESLNSLAHLSSAKSLHHVDAVAVDKPNFREEKTDLDNDGDDNRVTLPSKAPDSGVKSSTGLGTEDVFLQLSAEYKDLYNQVLESWFFLRTTMTKEKYAQIYEQLYDRYRNTFSHADRFREVLEPFKEKYAKNLTEVIFQRLQHLQNPEDCSKVKFALCDIGKGCGFGCQIHHVAYCLMVSYALQRTLALNGKPWSYAANGFTSVFHPLGGTDKCADYISKHPAVDWNGNDDQGSSDVIKIPIVDSIHRKPKFMPMAIPEDLQQLKSFHTQPFVFYVGHFLRYVLRPLPSTCSSIRKEIETRFGINVTTFDKIKPLVGIQVRRTDKLLSEAQFHSVGEYMKWVAEYYDQLEYKLGKKVVRSVYIATDEPAVLEDAKKEFPTYKFYCDPAIAKSASLNSRYSDNSLNGILIDMFFLARSDFIVCTFSSQVCRLGFALMQTIHGDAGDRFRSLDDIYYYGGQMDHMFEAVLPHTAAGNEEIDIQPGDMIHIAGNHWNGFSKGTNKRTGKHGLFPAYKVRDVVYTAKMPSYSEVSFVKDYSLPQDSCLVV